MVDNLRLVFSSSQCTGKTTLINAIKKKYPIFGVQREPIRGILKDKEKVNYADDSVQLRILSNQRDYLLYNKFVLADRSCLDSFVYTDLLRSEGKSDIDDKTFSFIKEESKIIMQSGFVDQIVFLPIEFDIIDDGFRTVDKDQQYKVQSLMEKYIKDWGLEYKVISPRGSVEERLDFVSRYIDPFLN